MSVFSADTPSPRKRNTQGRLGDLHGKTSPALMLAESPRALIPVGALSREERLIEFRSAGSTWPDFASGYAGSPPPPCFAWFPLPRFAGEEAPYALRRSRKLPIRRRASRMLSVELA
jgi:hypothetical protein